MARSWPKWEAAAALPPLPDQEDGALLLERLEERLDEALALLGKRVEQLAHLARGTRSADA